MKVRQVLVGAAFCAATALWSGVLYSQTKDEKKPAGEKPAMPAAEKPGDKPKTDTGGGGETDPMMKLMQEMSAPGKEHETLKPLVGSFTCTTKIHGAPGGEPVESTGTVERKWILGNRYIQEEVKATMMGMPFEGFGVMGYDKLQKFYHAFWIDSMGTGTWSSTGTADASGKVISYTGENFNPMFGQKIKERSTVELLDNNKHTVKMYAPGPDGKEMLTFEMSCTRK